MSACEVSEGSMELERPEEDLQNLLCCGEDGTVEVHRWFSEVSFDVVKCLRKCVENIDRKT